MKRNIIQLAKNMAQMNKNNRAQFAYIQQNLIFKKIRIDTKNIFIKSKI